MSAQFWIPYASYCTTARFAGLGGGFQRHCGPTAAVNLICTLLAARRHKNPAAKRISRRPPEELFLLCAEAGRRTRAYWNMEALGRFGGTSNVLTGPFLRSCLRAAGFRTGAQRPLERKKEGGEARRGRRADAGSGNSCHSRTSGTGIRIRFHPWITAEDVAVSLDRGEIVYLEVYRHPKYKNHHMLCYAYRVEDGRRLFLLADGWEPRPVWVGDRELGHGHFLSVADPLSAMK